MSRKSAYQKAWEGATKKKRFIFFGEEVVSVEELEAHVGHMAHPRIQRVKYHEAKLKDPLTFKDGDIFEGTATVTVHG